jgi:hypothetical protein
VIDRCLFQLGHAKEEEEEEEEEENPEIYKKGLRAQN